MPDRPQPRVLVVEDDPDTVVFLQVLLTPDYVLEVGPDLASARALFDPANPPRVVVLDLRLPDGDGLEFCREVKAATPTCPVIVVTAYRGRRGEAFHAGASHVFVKPVDALDLRDRIREASRRPGDPPP